MDVQDAIQDYVERANIPIFATTTSEDFEQALPGMQPRELMPRTQSMLIFGRPFIEYPQSVDEKTHLADDGWWLENNKVFEDIAQWRGEIVNILDSYGFGAANHGGFWLTTEPTFSYRLVMHRAGLGVYGRFGVCIHPEYGCYFRVGVILSEAELAPTPVPSLADFDPCKNCNRCADVCPVRAIDPTMPPATGYNRELCMRFILKIKERYRKESDSDPYGVKVCNRCFGVCPYADASRLDRVTA